MGRGGWALVLVLAWPGASVAAESALEIEAEGTVALRLDGVRTASTGPGGVLRFARLTAGAHRLEARRVGFEPQSLAVYLGSGETRRVTLRPWVPRPRSDTLAWIAVEARPGGASLKSARLGWEELSLRDRPLVARVPAREHRLTACNEVKCMDFSARPRRGRGVHVLVDFEEGKVLDISKSRADALRAAERRCRAAGEVPACLESCDWQLALDPAASEGPSCRRLFDAPPAILEVGRPGFVLPATRSSTRAE